MRRPIVPVLGLLAVLVVLGSCVDGSLPVAPREGRSVVRLPLAASLVPSAADAAARPINRIRATARLVPGGEVVGEAVLDVDAAADGWEVGIDVDVAGPLAQILVDLALIHVDAAGQETVEFSGQVGPLAVRPGDDLEPANIQVVRGPADNLAVTGLEIVEGPALVEGSTRTLTARVTTSNGGGAPVVFWTALTPTVLGVDGTTATAALPGTARVVASAGTIADTVTIQVLPRPDRVTLSPTSVVLDAIGQESTLTASVLDPRGSPIAGQPLLWRSRAPAVVEMVSGGRFRAVGFGETTIDAIAVADTTRRASATVRVARAATDVAVTKTANTPTAFTGDVVTFTVGVTNQGGAAAADVRVRDLLPTGLALEGAPSGTGSYDATTGIWSVGALLPGARASLEVRARVTAAPGSRVSNVAERIASLEQTDLDAANDRAVAVVSVLEPVADLALQKTVSRSPIFEGDTATFTVTVTNLGTVPAVNVLVLDSLPAGLTVLSEAPSTGTFTRANGWAIGRLEGGESAHLTLGVRAELGSGGTSFTNVARIAGMESPRDPNAANDRATATLAVQIAGASANVAVSKSAVPTAPAVGDTVVFTIAVFNQGPDSTLAVQVRDSLPAGLTFVSAVPSAGTFDPQTLVWTVGTVHLEQTHTLTLRAVVGPGTAGQTLTNTARILAGRPIPDFFPGNDVATASVTVASPRADLELFKAVDVANPAELAPVRFTVTVTNLGPDDATGVQIADRLPAGLQLDSVRTATGTVTADTLWTIPSLPVSASGILYVYARVLDGTGGTTITTQARRVASTPADPASGNDVATRNVTVARRVLDLVVRKTASDPHPVVGSGFVYTVTLVNQGPGTATNVVVTDTLPTQLTLDSVRASTGTFASNAWSVPSLAQGDSATLRAYVRVPGALGGQTVANVARRTSAAQDDANAANDSARVTLTIPVSNPPVVTITAPGDGAVYDPGDTIVFQGTASDQEDGPLTSSIIWTSNVTGALGSGAQVSTSTLAPGPHVISARVTDSNGNLVADTVGLTIAIVTSPLTLNVPFGGTASLPISLSAPAPAGGLTLTITSANTGVVNPVSTTVTIPAGGLSANAQLSGVTPGTAVVTASTLGYGSSSTTVSVTAALNVTQGSVSFAQGYSANFTVRLESQGIAIAAPTGGLAVTLTAADPLCVSVPASVTIPAGQVQAAVTATWGGQRVAPCNTAVTASASGVTSDALTVYVEAPPYLTLYGVQVGSGLQTNTYVYLSYAGHGGTTIRLTSSNPSRALLAPDANTPGTATLDLPLGAGQTSVAYYLQGVAPDTGAVSIYATAPGMVGDTIVSTVQQSYVSIVSLGTTMTSLDANQAFRVYVGISDIYYGGVNAQAVRAGGSTLTATLSLSDSVPAVLVTSGGSARTATVQVPPGQYQSPTTVAAGGVAFDPLAAGTTTVTASIPGLLARPGATVGVTVSAPDITVYGNTVGMGLQTTGSAYLQSGAHGGVTVRVESTDPSVMLISPNASTPGSAFIDVPVANGQTYVPFHLQGLEGQQGTRYARVTAPGFLTDSAAVTVAPTYITLSGLYSPLTTLNANVGFQAHVGVSDIYYGGVNVQAVRAGGTPITAQIVSSDSTRARLVTSGDSGDTVSVTIAVGQYNSPTTLATGGVQFDPLNAGTTTVSVTAPGVLQRPNATAVITLTAPTITAYDYTVGSGLQTTAYTYLEASQHGGVTVHIESLNPAVALISPNASTPGTTAIDVVVPNGQTSVAYTLQGVESVTGTPWIRVTAPGFTADSAVASVVQSYIALGSLPTNTTTLSSNSSFYVYVGTSDLYYGGVNAQPIRAGGSPATITVSSSVVGVGQIVTGGVAVPSAVVQIPVGQYQTTGGLLAFDPVGSGTTTVSASAPGFAQRPNANFGVTVAAPVSYVYGGPVGAGLQFASSFSLGAGNHGGVTVVIRSSSPSLVRLAPNASTPGADSVAIFVPNGGSSGTFYIQGMEGVTGTVTLTLNAPGFTDGTTTVDVQQPALALVSVPTSIAAAAADRLFYVYVGVSDIYYGGVSVQNVRAGGVAPTATVTSSQPAVGRLVTAAQTGGSVPVTVAVGDYRTPTSVAAGGIAFDPLAGGSTTLSATIPGFVARPNATVNVTVTP